MTDYAYPTADFIEIETDYGDGFLRASRDLYPGALIYVGDTADTEVCYRTYPYEACRDYCPSCAEILEWADGFPYIYHLYRLVYEDVE